jgi:signal transduction histidine kinase
MGDSSVALHLAEPTSAAIAMELHDGLGQELYYLSLLAATIARAEPRDPSTFRDSLTELQGRISQALDDCRRLSHRHLGTCVDNASLPAALKALAEKFSAVGSGERTVVYQGARTLPPSLALWCGHHLYRIAQEAVTNAVRATTGGRVVISLRVCQKRLRLAVSSPASGFLPTRSAGVGLATMRARARRIGATLRIAHRRDGRLVLSCSLPVANPGRRTHVVAPDVPAQCPWCGTHPSAGHARA